MKTIEEIEDDFAFLDDWEDRYRYVIELGRELPPLAADEKTDATKVSGCASQVWLVVEPGGEGLTVRGESDAHIVQGLVALVTRLTSGRPPAEIAEADPRAFFERIGLVEHLTQQRANGLNSMIARVKAEAAART